MKEFIYSEFVGRRPVDQLHFYKTLALKTNSQWPLLSL